MYRLATKRSGKKNESKKTPMWVFRRTKPRVHWFMAQWVFSRCSTIG